MDCRIATFWEENRDKYNVSVINYFGDNNMSYCYDIEKAINMYFEKKDGWEKLKIGFDVYLVNMIYYCIDELYTHKTMFTNFYNNILECDILNILDDVYDSLKKLKKEVLIESFIYKKNSHDRDRIGTACYQDK